ncbi:hypothetical protein H4R24_001060 [Coemansia sp. RSA 988]|nr:hypothetical protein H4R24_001060 [Coemansia sp. RSA 988]
MPKTPSKPAALKRNARHISAENRNTFPFVLYQLVDSGIYRCLCWNDNGDGVVITSKDSIVDIVLPNHFNTREFASFTRQFHIYGFRRVTDNRKAKNSTGGHCEFTHLWFRRGKQELLHKIVRSASKKCPPTNSAPAVGNGSLSQRIGVLAINEPAPTHDCGPAAAVTYDISPRIAPAVAAISGTAPQCKATASASSEMSVVSRDACIPTEDITPSEPPAADLRKLVESPDSKNACCALQTLTDIHENLDPEVLNFVRHKLGYLLESIDCILQNSVVSPMSLPYKQVAPVSAPASTVDHVTPEVHPHAATTAVNPALFARTLSMGNPVPSLSLPATGMTSNITRLSMLPPIAPHAPVLSGNVFGNANSYSVTPTNFSTHNTSSPMCSSMENSPYVPMTTATTPITVGPIAGGFPLLYPPSVAPEHIQSQPFGMNCLEIYNALPFGGVATAPPTTGGKFFENIN